MFLKNLNLYQMTNDTKQELIDHITYNFNCYTSNIIDRPDFINAIEEYIETL
jgi:hypothetical protein